ncbi:hypothetical protein GOP47_0011341 [Adiantum capillus-veneris]|nr:hypothetical protein GOP47_0011341 [Adiantum capillus-veneris]
MSVIAGSYGYIAPEYAYTMKITSKCDVFSFGVVLLELISGRVAVQLVEHGGDLVTWIRSCLESKKALTHILDERLDLQNTSIVAEILIVLKIALLCTNILPIDRPSMREIVCMLKEARNDNEAKLRITHTIETFTIEGLDISNIFIQV